MPENNSVIAEEFEPTASYQVGKMTFVVERIFPPEGAESVASILVKLMKTEAENPKS